MSFWTSQQLEAELPKLVDDFQASRVDCNAYTLRIGAEVYVSPSDETSDPKSRTIRRLEPTEAFPIPPGQFAFLVSEEIVRIPNNAMAFISMKAKIKFKGLVNVSGFHVDPGYNGRLVFSVFNAGPTAVHLKRGQDCFLIWFAGLEEDSKKNKGGMGNTDIPPELITAVSGELQSLEGLNKKIKDVEKRIEERYNKTDTQHAELNTRVTILTTLAGGLLIAAVLYVLRGDRAPSSPTPTPPAATAPSTAAHAASVPKPEAAAPVVAPASTDVSPAASTPKPDASAGEKQVQPAAKEPQ